MNTDLAAWRGHAGRFLQRVVEYKHKIGFKGVILIEPKPQEPTKHQYDHDVATVCGLLKDFGLDAAAARVTDEGLDPQPRSGRQERLENLWNRYV